MEYKFKGYKSKFIYVQLGHSLSRPSAEQIRGLIDIATKYKLSAKEISMLPWCSAHQFDDAPGSDDDYVFMASSPEGFNLTEEDKSYWKEALESTLSEDTADKSEFDYPIIVCTHAIELKRIKKILLPFI
jgi:hypothetical protein